MTRLTLSLALVWIVAAQAAQAATINASLAASRISGVAPLAVYFDATATTHSTSTLDPFADLHYAWSFGDTNSGSWAISGKSRNLAFGPVSAHVFETPGTYIVQLTVRDGAGTTASRQATITVADPNVVFSGSLTTCVSATGNFTGCPAGAQKITNSSFNAAMGSATTGRRVLLRRGDTFSSPATFAHGSAGPGVVGAYGTGARPVITSNHAGDVISTSNTDWRYMDLEFRGPNGVAFSQAFGGRLTKRLLLLRIEASLFHTAIGYSPLTLPFFGEDFLQMQEFYLVDSRIRDGRGGGGGNGIGMAWNKLVIMGSEVINMTSVEHTMRLFHVGGGVISNNRLGASGANKVSLKLHAIPFGGPGGQPAGLYSERIVISDNRFEAGNLQNWTFALESENQDEDERIRTVIVERNHFTSGNNSSAAIVAAAAFLSVRNNIFDLSGTTSAVTGVAYQKTNSAPAPLNGHFENNTCYASSTPAGPVCMKLGNFAGTRAYNNLIYAPNAPSEIVVSGGGDLRNNILATTNPFVVASPSASQDFQLKAGASGIDAGVAVGSNALDFTLGGRPADGDSSSGAAWDVGAFERNATGSTTPPPSTPQLPAAQML